MDRIEAMDIVAAARRDAAVLTGPGVNSGLLYARADAPATIYNMDMGYATAMALGVALARPDRKVLSIEGDGSFFAGAAVLSTIRRMRPENLVVVVLDNEVWGTGDGTEPSATGSGADLARLALANGWDAARVHTPSGPNELADRMGTAMDTPGPHLVVCKTDTSRDMPSSPHRPVPGRHQLDCAVLMRAELSGET
ncbi:MAG: thiamine pyrophosphate-dependent enzyme [Defluviicoccus sp.]|nr:thiamine pyrophosphate-dependent enzyme [Defluviicoccus sp.]MDE0385547.1 thiamine pyrophosphate-dependent enzyme [Defluviicoccus sp.]